MPKELVAVAPRMPALREYEDEPLSPGEIRVKTEFGAKTMALDAKTHNLYVDTSDFDPAPAPTPQQPNPQPVAKPGTFRLLVYGPQGSAKTN